MRVLAYLFLTGLTGCAAWSTQIKSDLEAVLPQCSTEAAITACQCAARVLRDKQCVKLKGEGKSGGAIPPQCRDAPSSQPR